MKKIFMDWSSGSWRNNSISCFFKTGLELLSKSYKHCHKEIFRCNEQLKKWPCHSVCSFVVRCSFIRSFVPTLIFTLVTFWSIQIIWMKVIQGCFKSLFRVFLKVFQECFEGFSSFDLKHSSHFKTGDSRVLQESF